MSSPYGSIILINGASSSGKSTLCAALQARLPLPFWHYSIDLDENVDAVLRAWSARARPTAFDRMASEAR